MTDRATQRREFTEIVREHGPWVLAWLSRRAPAGVDPDDLAQEVFLALSRGRDRIRKPDRIHAWLFGVAKRILAREIERAKRRRRVEAEGGVVRMSHPPPADLGPLDEAIARLPEDLAAVVTTYLAVDGDLSRRAPPCGTG